LTSAANGSGISIDTCATLCLIRCKVGRHFVDALAADQVSRLASYFCTPLSFKLQTMGAAAAPSAIAFVEI